jgi:hypothetical protein
MMVMMMQFHNHHYHMPVVVAILPLAHITYVTDQDALNMETMVKVQYRKN